MPNANAKTRKNPKLRISKVGSCIRKRANTVSLKRTMMPDSPHFDPALITPEKSNKFTKLIETIHALDAEDFARDGTKYKHFIFTDIREAAHGAKACASFLIAAGFDFRMKKRTGFIEKEPVANGSNGFAILQSLPLWGDPLTVKAKKQILGAYNQRPDNIHGEQLRIIILDSKYKEGIDLFDVKYVHLLEPAIASSDLKQAVGRATRFCGQRGLHFVPKKGWALQVYIYNTELPTSFPTHDAHSLMLQNSGLDISLLNLTKELTVLSIASSVDYDLNYKINNFDITAALLEAVGSEDTMIAEVSATEDAAVPVAKQSGGAKTRATVKAIMSVDEITPEMLERCGKRKSRLFPFSKVRMIELARKYKIPTPKKAKRAYYCEQLSANPAYLEDLLVPYDEPKKRTKKPQRLILPTPAPPTTPRASRNSRNRLNNPRSTPVAPPPTPRTSRDSPDELYFPEPLTPNSETRTSQLTLRSLMNKPFADFQAGIINLYSAHQWAAPIVKSGCDSVQGIAKGQPVSFSKTQDFIRHYLTPSSPFKGLLAWHSVGTGKTCMAVAAATTAFEQAGYTILWVTRNALMSDVYKNIFGSVCSIPMIEYVKRGKIIPDDLTKQKKLLNRAFLPPISYRTFQNALQGKNELGRILRAKNPDPLHKTFLVMDEVHKLLDGDLGAAETADFSIIQNFIHASYSLSNRDSVRPLLMTATPITDKPSELFDILNTLIPSDDARLMNFSEFRDLYSDADGHISAEGRAYFQERAKGLISYLNRELDPTTFAQPEFHTISVPLLSFEPPSAVSVAERCDAGLNRTGSEDDCDQIETELAERLEAVMDLNAPGAKREAIKNLKKTYKARIRECRANVKGTQKRLRKDAARCYKQARKSFVTQQQNSQISALQDCIGLKSSTHSSTFPLRAEVEEILFSSKSRESQRSNRGTLGNENRANNFNEL